MSLEYTNRRGTRYFAFQGETKTGKPKFFASRKPDSDKGVRSDSLPDEFEIFEHPESTVVTIRKRQPTRVLPAERDLVHQTALQRSACSTVQTVIEGDRIVVYTAESSPRLTTELSERFGLFGHRIADVVSRTSTFSAELRFTLVDAKLRVWQTERYCYRSAIDGWTRIGRRDFLDSLAEKYAEHLGQESFFELF